MGIDKSLGQRFPTVEINGMLYRYGKIPAFAYWKDGWKLPYPDEWIVENENDAEDSFCFRSEQEMIDFLENLPESALPTAEGLLMLLCGIDITRRKHKAREEFEKRLRHLLEAKRRMGQTYPYQKK